ncbi:glycosyltransferase [Thioalkalivibrio sp. ALE11]|uniref:glycosyltransferase n=1 Tax=Thioalkalivibrio sp. ALE11 TaxID=1265494 RepID=UPI000373D8BD|nr:glycosyltransferase [Thioalkalivibrio sp. ALE11]
MGTEDDVQRLQRELEDLRRDYRRLHDSASYRLGNLLVGAMRSPRKALALPVELFRLGRELRRRRCATEPGAEQVAEVEGAFRDWCAHVQGESAPFVVMIFSGTTHVQGTRGNRPIRQAQALLRQGAAVLFSYHRGRVDEPIPTSDEPGLLQSPADITLGLQERIASADYGVARKLCVISYPRVETPEMVSLFREQGWTVQYDCRDDWEEFARVGMARWYVRHAERRLVESVDATLCVSRPLCEKMQAMAPGRPVHLSPNAVEAGFVPVEYQREPARDPGVVGYFGHLSDAWFDWSSFLEVARQCPELEFEVIGHSAPSGLDLPANVTLLGPKPWTELHTYAARWSAAVIPFRMGRLADGVDPIKIYEYLALGLPVVSFRMPQIEDYPATETVSSVDAFAEALRRACVEEPDPETMYAFVAKNTWENRARELLSFVAGSA